MSVNSKMTALADEIRALSGTENAMGLDVMKTHISEANDEIASQVETGIKYSDPVDVVPYRYTYEETDEKIDDEVPTQVTED